LALLAALFGANDSLLLASIALACRALLCRCVEHRFHLPLQPYLLIPIRDLISFFVFVSSFFGTAVSWRGFSYHVTSDGRLEADRNGVQ